MAAVVVKAKVPKLGGKEIAVNYDFGETMQEAAKRFGEAVVFSSFKAESVIALQSRLRDWAQKGKSDAEIAELAKVWKPGVASPRVAGDPVAKYEQFLSGLTDDKALEQIERLKKVLAAKKAAAKQQK